MKKNIRYVAVYLGLGRVVPNEAASVLKNKFGDCKDKVTLMSALLSAKGIASEAVLINLGNAYTLPEPPILGGINHVILYLPDFDLYDDPTVSEAAFGVLATQAYDKPVVRVSRESAKLARTPAMRPEDHTARTFTRLAVGADGAISGQTQETHTGTFATALRAASEAVRALGDETMAQRLLQSYNTPGHGHVDVSNSGSAVDPVTVAGSFTLNDRFKAPAPGARAIIPFGMPLTVRPGNFLLGVRLGGRQTAFVCYAGRQTEDIEATFDPALPMPVALAPANIENPLFGYHSTFTLAGRTLKVHREFVSRVGGQVCPAGVEAQIADAMRAVSIDVATAYPFATASPPAAAGAPNPAQIVEIKRALTMGQRRQIDFLFSLNIDCSSIGFATVRVIEQPRHGTVVAEHATGNSTFLPGNPRSECNSHQSDGTAVYYQPETDFTGEDSVTIESIFASGTSTKRHYSITVSPVLAATPTPSQTHRPPQTFEFARVAAADQRLAMGFVFDLNPDCSSIGYATIQVSEPPKHGKLSVENGTGFSTFAANNPRFECNRRRTDGVVLSYDPDSGFTGADSLMVEVLLPDGSSHKRHYSIEVK
jgi:hypothetical protein